MCKVVSEARWEPESRGKSLYVSLGYRLSDEMSIGDGKCRKMSVLMDFGDGLGAGS